MKAYFALFLRENITRASSCSNFACIYHTSSSLLYFMCIQHASSIFAWIRHASSMFACIHHASSILAWMTILCQKIDVAASYEAACLRNICCRELWGRVLSNLFCCELWGRVWTKSIFPRAMRPRAVESMLLRAMRPRVNKIYFAASYEAACFRIYVAIFACIFHASFASACKSRHIFNSSLFLACIFHVFVHNTPFLISCWLLSSLILIQSVIDAAIQSSLPSMQ